MRSQPACAKERMANYLALMQELQVEKARERDIMRQIVEILSHMQTPNALSYHTKVSTKTLSQADMTYRLLIPKSDAKSMILPHLNAQEDVKIGVPVMVYGKDGSGYFMTFKLWGVSHVLCANWSLFIKDQGLQLHDEVALWLFSSRHPTRDLLRFAVTVQAQLINFI